METVGSGCRLIYDQEVDTQKVLLNALAPVARFAFRANHLLMMRHGQAGLRTFMAGYTPSHVPAIDAELPVPSPALGDSV